MTSSSTPKLILFDGNAILHRAYHAFPLTLQTREGELTNAVYGFTSTLLTVFKKFLPTHTIVAFDEKGPTFRHEQYQGYKANRPKMDESLACQIQRTKEVVRTLNIPMFGVSGYEADDLLGTLAYQAQVQGVEDIVIVTGDRDELQLITNKVKVYFPSRGKQPDQLFDEAAFSTKYGFKPIQLIDYKALAGDSSDEIPGVRGIGPKAATQLIQQFGGVDQIYDHLSEISLSIRQKLENNKEMAFLSKQLATISLDAPVTFDLSSSRLADYDKQKVITLFENLEFRTLIHRLPNDGWEDMVTETITSSRRKSSKEIVEDKQMKLF